MRQYRGLRPGFTKPGKNRDCSKHKNVPHDLRGTIRTAGVRGQHVWSGQFSWKQLRLGNPEQSSGWSAPVPQEIKPIWLDITPARGLSDHSGPKARPDVASRNAARSQRYRHRADEGRGTAGCPGSETYLELEAGLPASCLNAAITCIWSTMSRSTATSAAAMR